MSEDVFGCVYTSSISASDILTVLALAALAAALRCGHEAQERDGRYRLDEKNRAMEIDTSTGFGKTMAHLLCVLMSELYIEDEYQISQGASTRRGKCLRRRTT